MHSTLDHPPQLAPLQQIMLRDTLAAPDAGHHVEQVEIVFAPRVNPANVIAAWWETVQQTAALQISFTIVDGNPQGWKFVVPPATAHLAAPPVGSFDLWLEADKLRPLLTTGEVPWRAVFWPETRRLVWTFHHALLDGRSIARILQVFFNYVNGSRPKCLALARWQPPTVDAITRAGQLFSRPIPVAVRFPVKEADSSPAIHRLGVAFINRLAAIAGEMEVTTATLVTWAWGHTILAASGMAGVWVEQLRAGAPQAEAAGFTMNLLPVFIATGTTLTQFQKQLHELRTLETVSSQDFSPGVFPDTTGPWASVIMVERGTLRHMTYTSDSIETLTLHERPGKTLAATAHLLPDLRLEVEGPGRHALLATWIDILKKLGNLT